MHYQNVCGKEMLWNHKGIVTETVMYQDNLSAMPLEVNEKSPSGKQTINISICYLFIKDRIDPGDVSVKYCPTGNMLGEHFTKPLRGGLF